MCGVCTGTLAESQCLDWTSLGKTASIIIATRMGCKVSPSCLGSNHCTVSNRPHSTWGKVQHTYRRLLGSPWYLKDLLSCWVVRSKVQLGVHLALGRSKRVTHVRCAQNSNWCRICRGRLSGSFCTIKSCSYCGALRRTASLERSLVGAGTKIKHCLRVI